MAIATGDARNGGCTVRVSRDGGLSWGEAQNIVPKPSTHCVQRNFGTVMGIAFGPDGTLHAALSASSVSTGHPNGPIAAVAARSTDLGRTWETKVVAEAKPYSQGSVQGFEQHGVMSVAVDSERRQPPPHGLAVPGARPGHPGRGPGPGRAALRRRLP